MNTYLVKYATPLILLFTLLSFTGVVTTAVAFTGQLVADICCGETGEGEVPVDSGECADIECRCASCAVSTLTSNRLYLLSFKLSPPSWETTSLLPSGHINAIEYPPEFC